MQIVQTNPIYHLTPFNPKFEPSLGILFELVLFKLDVFESFQKDANLHKFSMTYN